MTHHFAVLRRKVSDSQLLDYSDRAERTRVSASGPCHLTLQYAANPITSLFIATSGFYSSRIVISLQLPNSLVLFL